MDMLESDPGYMDYVGRVIQALSRGLQDLQAFYTEVRLLPHARWLIRLCLTLPDSLTTFAL